MSYRFRLSSFLGGCLATFLVNASVLLILVFMGLHIHVLVRFIDVVGGVIEGYSLGQNQESISTWRLVSGVGALIAKTAAFGVIGNLLGWYSYWYLTAQGRIQAGCAAFLSPLIVGLLIGNSLVLLACFIFSFLCAAVFKSLTEDQLLQGAQDFLRAEHPSVEFSPAPHSLRSLLSDIMPPEYPASAPLLLKVQERLFNTYGVWIAADHNLLEKTSSIPPEKQVQA